MFSTRSVFEYIRDDVIGQVGVSLMAAAIAFIGMLLAGTNTLILTTAYPAALESAGIVELVRALLTLGMVTAVALFCLGGLLVLQPATAEATPSQEQEQEEGTDG